MFVNIKCRIYYLYSFVSTRSPRNLKLHKCSVSDVDAVKEPRLHSMTKQHERASMHRHFESKHIMGDKRHFERVVETPNLQDAKTVVTPDVRESENLSHEGIPECSWESLWTPQNQNEKASLHDEVVTDKTGLCRSTVARLNCWALDRPDMLYAVRVCSKSMASPGANSKQRLKRFSQMCPDAGIMFVLRTASSRFAVWRDIDWTRDKSTRKSI